MKFETINEKAVHSWDGQRSDNPQVQSIINHGFWVDIVGDTLVSAFMYGIGESEWSIGDLPPVLMIRNEGDNKVKVVFKIDDHG